MPISLIAIAAAQLATPQLAPMEFVVGHCWQGRFYNGHVDTHCFEPAYGGRFIRDRHEVRGGPSVYSGETLFAWNPDTGRVEYTYWNSSGGISRGSMTQRDGVLDFGDEVHRTRDGREIRIGSAWRRIDETSYEMRIRSSDNPTGSRAVRYTRVDRAPVEIEVSTAADGTRTLTHQLVVPAPVDQVYAALTTPEGWRTWAVRSAWVSASDPDLMETSYAPGAGEGDPRNIRQRYLLRVPNRLVAFRTVQAPAGFPHAEEFYRVTHLIELEPASGGTRVRLSNIGYPAGAAGDTLIGFFREGNRTSLEQLRARFVSGPIDWSQRQQQAARR